MYARLRGIPGPPPIGVRYRCSPLSRDAIRWVHIHNMFLSGIDFWRYLDKVYNSVPGKARDQVNFVDVDGNDILKRRY
jgi:hypothetical protein